ncbi:MAG TPA: metallophosphoesterase, partial [Pseudonocardiaceae bacterium]|nr:metallophosphoesterase [Pseudonocardiaceae bacterium]
MSEKEQGTPQYEVARLQHALAEDARTAELGVDVTIVEDAVVLSGQVVGPRRRAALGEVIAEQAPSLVVRNDVQVVPAAEPDAPPGAGAIRIAAVGDVHLGPDTAGRLRPALEHLPECADVLLLAGDHTRRGTAAEAEAAAAEFADLGVPVLAVLGNHDHHSDAADEVAGIFDHRGIRMLEGQAEVL